MKYLGLEMTFQEIIEISKRKYKELIKVKIAKVALKYLLGKRGKKGSEISYSSLEMAEYLMPFNNILNIEEKQKLFEVRNRMINIPFNFSSKSEYECKCGKKEDMEHIYICEIYNEEDRPILPYVKIFNGNLNQQIEVYRKFKQNLEKRGKVTSNPCDLNSPLLSVRDIK